MYLFALILRYLNKNDGVRNCLSQFYVRKSLILGIILVSHVLFPQEGMADSGFGQQFIFPLNGQIRSNSETRSKKFYLTPFKSLNSSQPNVSLKSLMLLRKGVLTPEEAVKMRLRNGVIDSKFGVMAVKSRSKNLTGRLTQDFKFFVNGFPLCDFFLKSHALLGRDPLIMGKVPDFDPGYSNFKVSDFPDVSDSIEKIASELELHPFQLNATKVSRCLKSSNGNLYPSYKIELSAAGLPYSATVDGSEVFSIQQQYFNIEGTVNGYIKNPVDAKTKVFSVNFTGDTYLNTTEFTTTTGAAVARATEVTHKFEYDAADEEFAEANAFIHVEQMYQWFKDLGYSWKTEQLTIRTREPIPTPSGDSQNNALYMPGGFDGKSGPMIAVADGDGLVLKDLPFDSDVVGHEFVHHVLFESLTSTGQNENSEPLNHSASLHEGLADFFSFALSGDACLGESICPVGSPACQIMTSTEKCLRSGETDIIFGTKSYTDFGAAVHLKGQVVSGMMWDVRNRVGVDAEDFTKLAFGMIDYLLESSTYSDWLIALLSADKELFDGKYGCEIAAAARERGFSEQVDEHLSNCKDFTPIEKNAEDPTPSEPPISDGSNTVGSESKDGDAPSKKRKSGGMGGFCGTITLAEGDPRYELLLLMVMLAMPFFLIIPKVTPVRGRSKD